MIKAYQSSTHVIADALPSVGETIDLDNYGQVKVMALWHNSNDNFIGLEYTNEGGKVFQFSNPFMVKV